MMAKTHAKDGNMPIELSQLVSEINPEQTVLFFGSGSSIPSHAPSVKKLIDCLSAEFRIPDVGFSLRELTSIIEQKASRRELIQSLRKTFKDLTPSGGLLNLPLYNWRSIFTTNYDDLLEQSYTRAGVSIATYTCNFDFSIQTKPDPLKLFKVHGSIEKDVCDGHNSRIIITDQDYDKTNDYREVIWQRFKNDISDSHLIIVGYSLADPHIKELIDEVAKINATAGAGKITLLLYTRDNDRASLYEMRGMRVCFGGIDEFAAALSKKKPDTVLEDTDNDYFYNVPCLRPVTIDVAHAINASTDASAMFNGWPATYADIKAGLTFDRKAAEQVKTSLLGGKIFSVIVGASGVGKTTASRQTILILRNEGYNCWEHKTDSGFDADSWLTVARNLAEKDARGCLFIDEIHSHLQAVNELIDRLTANQNSSLKVIGSTTRNHWNPRVKSANLYKYGSEIGISQLCSEEISRLLNLIDSNNELRLLTEPTFSGFSRQERRRRLEDRCEADMFVCLKNIFAFEKFDDIILREYAGLSEELQNVYKLVAAMETAGIRVHRQLIIRLLGIPAITIQAMLINLTDIISEYVVNPREGIYGWKGRHTVIVKIISKYKFSNTEQLIKLFSDVIDCISPSYEIEIRTIRELCNIDSGLQMIPDKGVQNTLLRKMISIAPGERVPRHRLIRNLIDLGQFEKAETEIRIFDHDFRTDGAVMRYKVSLLTARAIHTPGILEEDRLAILNEAKERALQALARFPDHKYIHSAHCELGIEIYKRTKDFSVYDFAMTELKKAEERVGDPELSKLIARFERQISGQIVANGDQNGPEE